MGQKTNGLAIAGFVVSIASLFINIIGLVGAVGLVLSAIGKAQVNRDGTGGGKLAVAGIVIGIISVIWGIVQYASVFA